MVVPRTGSSCEERPTYSAYFLGCLALFVTSLLTANVIAIKLFQIGPLVLPAGIIIFPISYILGDVFTEVYGYRRARQVIWVGFACNALLVAAVWVAIHLPPASFWPHQKAFQTVLGFTPRLLVASFLAYLAGEFSNAYVLARLKVATSGRWLWLRTIGSTLVGQALDSTIFIGVAFAGLFPLQTLFRTIVAQWLVKSSYEALVTPFTYLVVNFLKRRENLDVYDRYTDFNPFHWD